MSAAAAQAPAPVVLTRRELRVLELLIDASAVQHALVGPMELAATSRRRVGPRVGRNFCARALVLLEELGFAARDPRRQRANWKATTAGIDWFTGARR